MGEDIARENPTASQLGNSPEISGEQLGPAELSIRIDPAALANVEIRPPSAEQYARNAHLAPEQAASGLEARVAELTKVLEILKRLPEILNFEPGITLIVGENGSGKSTLAKAICFVAEYIDHVERNFVDHGPMRAKELAFQSVFSSDGTHSETQSEKLALSGLGALVAPAMLGGSRFRSEAAPYYMDVGEIYGRAIDIARQLALDHHVPSVAVVHGNDGPIEVNTSTIVEGTGAFHIRSARQTVDEELRYYRDHRLSQQRTRKRFNTARASESGKQTTEVKGCIEFVDEPENGLSPRRHQRIEQEIYDVFGAADEGNIIVVPTNSVVLFESNLPRIDLDYPERGVHKPSDYPESIEPVTL
ncbi:AAA family ATPase [Candidatus Saccharibacteria bacterium]|nr:AAA family ATPase [Candidatus Saccharibacteria bacterium]